MKEVKNKVTANSIVTTSKDVNTLFNEVYRRYYKLVYSKIKSMISLVEDVEEITNNVFISFLEHISSFDCSNSISAYLLAITKNKVLDYFRKKKYEEVEYNDDIYYDDGSNDHNNLDYEYLHSIIKKVLTSDELLIFEYNSIYDYSFSEIAKLLNSNVNTVKSKYLRAKKKIRNYLENNKELIEI